MKRNEATTDKEIISTMNQLSETHPEEEYAEQVEAEALEDPEALEKARKKLMLMITMKCKGMSSDLIIGQIKPMVYKMNISDCENMTKTIKKKGMYGLPLMLNKKIKHG